jgi:hypothetical protein
MKKGTKNTGVIEAYKPMSSLRLEGAHAQKTASQKVGETHTITLKAKKTGHNVNSDGTHSASYEPTSVSFEKETDEGNKGGKGGKEKQSGTEGNQPSNA